MTLPKREQGSSYIPKDTWTDSVLPMTVTASLGVRPLRANKLIWYSVSGARSRTSREVWAWPTYSSWRLGPDIMGTTWILYPDTSPKDGSHVRRMDLEANSST